MRPFAPLLLALASTSSGGEIVADLVVEAARIETLDDADSSYTAIAVKDGAVLRVGSFDELRSLVGEKTQTLRFPGALVVPGFEDSHIHLLGGGLSLFQVDLFQAGSLEEIRERVREFAEANSDEPWILGSGWQYTALPQGRLPTAEDLDGVAPGRPVLLTAYDGHTAWVNRPALERAGVDASTEVGGYGEIVKDAGGRPTGTLKESAMRLVRKHVPEPSRDKRLEALRRATAKLASLGTVAIQNASGSEEELGLYETLLERGELDVRVAMAISVGAGARDAELDRIAELARRHRGPWLKVVGVKIVADGVIESHTAAMIEPYADGAGAGEPVLEARELDSLVLRAHRAGLQIWIHAIGDRAVRMALDAFERAQETHPVDDPRFRIEHIESIHADDVPRFRKLGVIAAMQPIHAYPSTVAVWSRAVGEARLPFAFAWESLRASGARLAFGTDWPASISVAPLRGIHNAVNRRTLDGEPEGGFVPSQRVSLEAALAAFTSGAAYAAFDETVRGALRVGQLADFVVLSRDPFALDPMRIQEVEPLLTVVSGRVTFRAGERGSR